MPTLSFDTLFIYLLFIVPGVVTLKVYDLFVSSERRSYGDSIVEVFFYSILNLGVMFTPIYLLIYYQAWSSHPFIFVLCAFLILFIAPAILAWLAFKLRYSDFLLQKWLVQPYATSWVLCHLKSGKRVGGYFGGNSCASAYPQPQEIYVEAVWRVDEWGRFQSQVKGTKGMLIRYDDCDLIEFLEESE